jgi:hypothetical protein
MGDGGLERRGNGRRGCDVQSESNDPIRVWEVGEVVWVSGRGDEAVGGGVGDEDSEGAADTTGAAGDWW